jgi:ribosome-associated heat shock protein Hsp15
MSSETDLTSQRIDLWLDLVCLYKTRSQAQNACKAGKVEVNGQSAKAHRSIREGDEIRMTRPGGRKQIVKVLGFAPQHVPKAQARTCYEDLTPPPTPEELEMRRYTRRAGVRRDAGLGAPKKKDRREIRKLRGR